jgi:Skp family chaperone for outer membrane proteins
MVDLKLIQVLKTFKDSARGITKEYTAISRKADSDLRKKIQKRTDKLDKMRDKGETLTEKLAD